MLTTLKEIRPSSTTGTLSAADAVWIATASLHEKHAEKDTNPRGPQSGFSTDEILQEVKRQGLTDKADSTIRTHIVQHCVANRKPAPNRTCELFALGKGYRRLYRPGDSVAENRDKNRYKPTTIPSEYSYLQGWYAKWCLKFESAPREKDPLLELIGIGKEIWADQHADEYVNSLREGWL